MNNAHRPSTIVYYAFLVISMSLLVSCSGFKRYNLDDTTAKHAATSVFISYIEAIEQEVEFDALSYFFSPSDLRLIEKSLGWQHLAFSASYRALKEGFCEEITTKPTSFNRAEIDCLGKINYKSFILGASQEKLHLRVLMILQDGQWYISRSGYVHTQNSGEGTEYYRVGIKFKSTFSP